MAGERKIYILDIHLDLHKGGRKHEGCGTVSNFEIKIGAGLKEGQEILIEGVDCVKSWGKMY